MGLGEDAITVAPLERGRYYPLGQVAIDRRYVESGSTDRMIPARSSKRRRRTLPPMFQRSPHGPVWARSDAADRRHDGHSPPLHCERGRPAVLWHPAAPLRWVWRCSECGPLPRDPTWLLEPPRTSLDP